MKNETSSTNELKLEAGDWRKTWRDVLAQCNKPIFIFDLDGTVWGDILVVLNEEFGPLDENGEKVWKRYDRAFKIEGTMSNGDHLEAEYRDLLAAKSLAELKAWLESNHRLLDGIGEFLAKLHEAGVTPVAASNGAHEIADHMLAFHGIEMPRVCNRLIFDNGRFSRMDFFHDEHDGIRKGDLVDEAHAAGHLIVGCAGDSKGDIGLARQTARLGGLVLAVGKGGLDRWCAENEGGLIDAGGWLDIDGYGEAMAALEERLRALG